MSALVHLLACLARYWIDPAFRGECDFEDALADEGEDGPTVARILVRMRERNPSRQTEGGAR